MKKIWVFAALMLFLPITAVAQGQQVKPEGIGVTVIYILFAVSVMSQILGVLVQHSSLRKNRRDDDAALDLRVETLVERVLNKKMDAGQVLRGSEVKLLLENIDERLERVEKKLEGTTAMVFPTVPVK